MDLDPKINEHKPLTYYHNTFLFDLILDLHLFLFFFDYFM